MSDTVSGRGQSAPRQELLDAARLVETTAFDIAITHPSTRVSELIVIAAKLEHLAQVIGAPDD